MDSSNSHAILQKAHLANWLRAHGKFVRPELTRQQKQEFKECFELMDADGSGAIDASELLTAFNVLGMHTKKSEVEAMLADVHGSKEVEYPEFVHLMTTKLDQGEDTMLSVYSNPQAKPTKQKALPFPLLARAYRRKKLMEAIMKGDKASQERIQVRADAAELERQALREEAANQKDAIQNVQQKASINTTNQRIRKNMKHKKNEYGKVSKNLEHLDPEVKNVFMDIHKRVFERHLAMQADRLTKLGPPSESTPTEPTKPEISPTKQADDTAISTSMKEVLKYLDSVTNKLEKSSQYPTPSTKDTSSLFSIEEYEKLLEFHNKVRHKPVMEKQLFHVEIVKKIRGYFDKVKVESKGNHLEKASIPVPHHPKPRVRKIKANIKVGPKSSSARPTWHL